MGERNCAEGARGRGRGGGPNVRALRDSPDSWELSAEFVNTRRPRGVCICGLERESFSDVRDGYFVGRDNSLGQFSTDGLG